MTYLEAGLLKNSILDYDEVNGVKLISAPKFELDYFTCQVGTDSLIMIKKNDKIVVRLNNLALGQFLPEQMTSYPYKVRRFPSLCKASDEFLFLIGGANRDDYMNSCVRYDVQKNQWEDMSFLNEGRMSHSSCFLGDKIYVFAGRNAQGLIDSIESLKITIDPTQQFTKNWKLIYEENEFEPREALLCAPLNESEIVIMGGYMNGENSSDIFIFNTVDRYIEPRDVKYVPKFRHYNNTCFKVAHNKVVALVETDNDPHLITFEKKEFEHDRFAVLKVFSPYSHPPEQLYQQTKAAGNEEVKVDLGSNKGKKGKKGKFKGNNLGE